MRIAILTSSRADYSQYYPLLKVLKADSFFDAEILAFGTHLSHQHGHTIDQIKADGFDVKFTVDTFIEGDGPHAICDSMVKTMAGFNEIWHNEKFDLVLALGDRYEMFAACASLVPYNIPLAHLHGGEKTEGAIDDAFRHAITHMATLHFTSTEQYRERVVEMLGTDKGVYNTGALSIDNLKQLELMGTNEFLKKFGIDLNLPSILITFHPETRSIEKNLEYTDELVAALREIKNYQLIITMPNADTMGSAIRAKLNAFIHENPNAVGVESFGTIGYLSCMKHCSLMLGNTSSGFLEASFFPKKVINLGERQTGRIMSANIINCKIKKENILSAVEKAAHSTLPSGIDLYGDGNAAKTIADILKQYHERI